MPEFILNTDGTGAPWENLSTFAQGFIEALFFSETAPGVAASEWFDPENLEGVTQGTVDGVLPCDSSVAELDADAFAKIKDHCDTFETANATLLARAYETGYDESQAGRDLYFTHAGHGVGYWDRAELDGGLGDELSDAAGCGEYSLFYYQTPNGPRIGLDMY